jgi:hypothetical protein
MKSWCRSCHAALTDDASFCPSCGTALLETAPLTEPNCPSCGAPSSAGARFCRDCGAALVATAGTSAATELQSRPATLSDPDQDSSEKPATQASAAVAGKPPKRSSKRRPPRRSSGSAVTPAAAGPQRHWGKTLLGLGALALLGLLLWQWLESEGPAFRSTVHETARIERGTAERSSPPPPPAKTPYDTTGIVGIVDIEEADPDAAAISSTTPAAVIGEATAKLPDLRAQVRSGNPRAMTSLALSQRSGLAGRAEPLSAIELLQRAAAAGDAHAMAVLAEEYEAGIWIEQDLRKAQTLRTQAAQAGSRLAQWELQP